MLPYLKQTPKIITSTLPRSTSQALELDFPFQINAIANPNHSQKPPNTTANPNYSQKPPSSPLSFESESLSTEMTVKPTEILKQQKSRPLPLRPSLQAYEVPIYLLYYCLFYYCLFYYNCFIVDHATCLSHKIQFKFQHQSSKEFNFSNASGVEYKSRFLVFGPYS